MKNKLINHRLAFVCILAALLLNFPIVSSFNKAIFIMGIPILYLYILMVLLFSIVGSMFIIRKK